MALGIGTAAIGATAWFLGRETGNYVAMQTPKWAAGAAYNAIVATGQSYLGTLGGYIATPLAYVGGLEAGGYAATAGLGGPAGLAAGAAVQVGLAYGVPFVAGKVYDVYKDYYGIETANEDAGVPEAPVPTAAVTA